MEHDSRIRKYRTLYSTSSQINPLRTLQAVLSLQDFWTTALYLTIINLSPFFHLPTDQYCTAYEKTPACQNLTGDSTLVIIGTTCCNVLTFCILPTECIETFHMTLISSIKGQVYVRAEESVLCEVWLNFYTLCRGFSGLCWGFSWNENKDCNIFVMKKKFVGWSVQFYHQRTVHPVPSVGPLKSPDWVNGIDLKGKTVLPSAPDLLYLSLPLATAQHNIQTSAPPPQLHTSNIPLPSSLPNALPYLLPTSIRRTSGYNLRTLSSANVYLPVTMQCLTLPSPFFLFALPILPCPVFPVPTASLWTQIRHN